MGCKYHHMHNRSLLKRIWTRTAECPSCKAQWFPFTPGVLLPDISVEEQSTETEGGGWQMCMVLEIVRDEWDGGTELLELRYGVPSPEEDWEFVRGGMRDCTITE
jgi:hypothetical protein